MKYVTFVSVVWEVETIWCGPAETMFLCWTEMWSYFYSGNEKELYNQFPVLKPVQE